MKFSIAERVITLVDGRIARIERPSPRKRAEEIRW